MKLGVRPSEFLTMDRQEKAFIIASIQMRLEAEKKKAAKLKRNKGK